MSITTSQISVTSAGTTIIAGDVNGVRVDLCVRAGTAFIGGVSVGTSTGFQLDATLPSISDWRVGNGEKLCGIAPVGGTATVHLLVGDNS